MNFCVPFVLRGEVLLLLRVWRRHLQRGCAVCIEVGRYIE